MDPDTLNCVILRIHVDNNNNDIIPSHAIQLQTSVSNTHWSKKTCAKVASSYPTNKSSFLLEISAGN